MPKYRVVTLAVVNAHGFRVDGDSIHEEALIEADLYKDYDLVCVSEGLAYFQLRPGRGMPPLSKRFLPLEHADRSILD